MNKWEMRKTLLSQGKTEEDLKNKSKEELSVMLGLENTTIDAVDSVDSEVDIDTILDQLEVTDNLATTQVPLSVKIESSEPITFRETNVVPDYLSPEWSAYVLSKFEKDELSDGAPNVHGLRRISQLLLGPIISTKIVLLQSTLDPSTYGRASVVYEIQIEFPDGVRVFQDCAGAYPGNTDKDYAKYPEAIAATRAEARCLRKALRIQGPASEEVCKTPTTLDIQTDTSIMDKISANQISMIKNRSQTYNINLDKLIEKITGEKNVLEGLKREQAQQICTYLNEIQTNRTDLTEDVLNTSVNLEVKVEKETKE